MGQRKAEPAWKRSWRERHENLMRTLAEMHKDERRCKTNIIGASGECLACNAEQGVACRWLV